MFFQSAGIVGLISNTFAGTSGVLGLLSEARSRDGDSVNKGLKITSTVLGSLGLASSLSVGRIAKIAGGSVGRRAGKLAAREDAIKLLIDMNKKE